MFWGLFLAPHDLRAGVLGQVLHHRVVRERRKLFHPHNGHVVDALFSAVLGQVVKHLARAEHDAADAFWGRLPGELGVVQHAAEVRALCHVVKRRHSFLVPEQGFGGRNHKRLAEVAGDLAPQHVEVVGGGGAVDHLPVGALDLVQRPPEVLIIGGWNDVLRVIALRQEPFDAARGMFGTLAFESMGKEHRDAALAAPLLFTRRDELVNDDLSTVDKVTKLSFPAHKLVGGFQRVPSFKPKHAKLGQGGVGDSERRRFGTKLVKHAEPLKRFLVVQNGVAMGERAALNVLARKPNAVAFSA
jgi:hypothetical protein